MTHCLRPPNRRASLSVLALILAALALAGAFCPGCVVAPTPGQEEPGRPGGVGEPDGTLIPGAAGGLASPPFEVLYATASADELPGQLVVYFLDTGQSDSTYIRTPDGRVILVDTGEDPDQVASFLEGKGVERVDALILTHPHEDHIGGALAVLDGFDVGTLYDPGCDTQGSLYIEILEKALALKDAGRLQYVEPREGMTLDFGSEVSATVLHPSEPLDSEPNETSIVVRLVYGTFSLLLTGDAGTESESAILDRGDSVGATVLKVGHHGSSGSSGNRFLDAVDPEAAVIEVGLGNSYNHPNPAALQRLADHDIQVFRTDLDGTVIVHSDGQDWGLLIAPEG